MYIFSSHGHNKDHDTKSGDDRHYTKHRAFV